MATPNVTEQQIALLLRDFTRAALMLQPPNLVEFARRYFQDLDETRYTNIQPELPTLNDEIPAAKVAGQGNESVPEITSIETLRELQLRLMDLGVSELQSLEAIQTVTEPLGVWRESLAHFVEEKAGELTHTMVLLYACSTRNSGVQSNLLESLKTMFEVMGDENGKMEVQEVVQSFTDLTVIHESIDQMLADQVLQFLLGQGFMDSDAEVTSKFDGKTSTDYQTLVAAPCLKEWAETHNLNV